MNNIPIKKVIAIAIGLFLFGSVAVYAYAQIAIEPMLPNALKSYCLARKNVGYANIHDHHFQLIKLTNEDLAHANELRNLDCTNP